MATFRCPSCEQEWDSDISICGVGKFSWDIHELAKVFLNIHQKDGFPIPCERAPEFVEYR